MLSRAVPHCLSAGAEKGRYVLLVVWTHDLYLNLFESGCQHNVLVSSSATKAQPMLQLAQGH